MGNNVKNICQATGIKNEIITFFWEYDMELGMIEKY